MLTRGTYPKSVWKPSDAIDVVQIVRVIAILLVEIDVVGVAAGVGSIQVAGLAGHRLAGQGPVLIEFEARVQGLHAVEAAGEFALGQKHAGVGLLAELALRADHADRRVIALVGIAGIRGSPPAPGRRWPACRCSSGPASR